MERTVELHALLREMLFLRHDAVHVVVAHCKGVACGLVVRTWISTCCAYKTVKSIVCIGMRHLSASLSTLWN